MTVLLVEFTHSMLSSEQGIAHTTDLESQFQCKLLLFDMSLLSSLSYPRFFDYVLFCVF